MIHCVVLVLNSHGMSTSSCVCEHRSLVSVLDIHILNVEPNRAMLTICARTPNTNPQQRAVGIYVGDSMHTRAYVVELVLSLAHAVFE